MAALDILRPLIIEIDSSLPNEDKKLAFNQFCSVYGNNYAARENLLSLLEQCIVENKINPMNVAPLEKGLLDRPSTKDQVRRIVETFKQQKKQEIEAWSKKQPDEFVGRDIGWLGSILDRNQGVILWGASGVGKTKLAKQFMSSKTNVKQVFVDLRGVHEFDVVIVETLKCFGKIVSIEDASIGLLSSVLRERTARQNHLLLFDNADDFVDYSGIGFDQTSEFASLVQEILVKSNGQLKIIVTSRNKSQHPAAEYLHQEQLTSLRDEAAVSIIKAGMLHETDHDSDKTSEFLMKTVKQCKNLPLNLNIIRAALQEQGVSLESILPIMVEKAEKWKKQKAKENAKVAEEDMFTYGVLDLRFGRLSDTTQLAAVALSLFSRTFSLKSIKAVLVDFSESKIHLIINHLKSTNFMNWVTGDVFEMHPKIREFLLGRSSSSQAINEFYLKVKARFIAYFKEQLVNISNIVDEDYLKAYDLYQENSSDFEFIFSEKDCEWIFVDSYHDNQCIAALFDGMLEPRRRLQLYQNLADITFTSGKTLIATQYLSQFALEEGFYNPVRAFDYTLLRVRHNLERAKADRRYGLKEPLFYELEGFYQYVKGDLLYKIAHSNFSLSDCEDGIAAISESVAFRGKIHKKGHTDIVRSYIVMGNLYNLMEDIHRVNKDYDKAESCLSKALEYYEKALVMRQKLSLKANHIDIPQILVNIGTIWNERGRLLQEKDRRAGKRSPNEIALVHFRKAEKFFEDALEMDSRLKLDGLYGTSVKLINLGDLQKNLREYDKAIENFAKALEIRRALKGDHKDTVLAIYRLGTTTQSKGNFKDAAHYFKEAFEMEERLPENYHTRVRYDIRKYLPMAYKMWANKEKDKSEGQRIKAEREGLEKKFKELEKEEKKKRKEEALGKKKDTGQTPKRVLATKPSTSTAPSTSGTLYTSQDLTLSREKSVGDFDRKSGFMSFRSLHVFLTLPRNVTETPQEVEVLPPDDVDIDLEDAEFIVSAILRFNTKVTLGLKSPALLEIQCDLISSRVDDFSELSMIQYDVDSSTWIDVESFAVVYKRFYRREKNEWVPVVQGWINQLSIFAVVLRPRREAISIPSSGMTWRPSQDDRISLEFPDYCFGETNSVPCTVKVVVPEQGILLMEEESHSLLLSPVINVKFKAKTRKPVKIAVPLLNKPKESGGCFMILRKDDGNESDFVIEESLTHFADEGKCIVEFEMGKFSWVMALWSVSFSISKESMHWITHQIFGLFRYDIDVHLFKRMHLGDVMSIAVSCSPVITSCLYRPERITKAEDMGYQLVESSPSLERISDLTLINVDVTGQFINASRSSNANLIRFNSKNLSPTPFRLEASGLPEEGGIVAFTTNPGVKQLCNIPYMKDFRLTSFSDEELDELQRRRPLRFLGIKMDWCGLENISINENFFRNNLHRTGLRETFIDELKLGIDSTSQQLIVKRMLDRITLLFVDEALFPDWFSVFRNYLHPRPTRSNLCQVMDILQGSRCKRNGSHIVAEMIDSPEAVCMEDPRTEVLFNIDDLKTRHEYSALFTYWEEFPASNILLLDYVREILKLQRNGEGQDAEGMLDAIESYVRTRVDVSY